MNKKRLFILLASIIALYAACKRGSTNVVCANGYISVFGLGFPPPDTLAYLITFKPDNAFDSVTDTTQILHFSFDTVYWPTLQSITLQPGNDYEIILLGTNNTYHFSKIKNGSHYTEEIANGAGNLCYNPVISYIFNGAEIKVQDTTETRGPLTIFIDN